MEFVIYISLCFEFVEFLFLKKLNIFVMKMNLVFKLIALANFLSRSFSSAPIYVVTLYFYTSFDCDYDASMITMSTMNYCYANPNLAGVYSMNTIVTSGTTSTIHSNLYSDSTCNVLSSSTSSTISSFCA